MDYWSGVFGNIVASLIGTGLGAIFGLLLYRHQLRKERLNNIQTAVESLLWELKTHKNLMEKHISYLYRGRDIQLHPTSYIFSTASYESIMSVGWISLFSSSTQKIVFQHYSKWFEINKILNRIAKMWPDTDAEWRDSLLRRSDEFYKEIKKDIDSVITTLKEEDARLSFKRWCAAHALVKLRCFTEKRRTSGNVLSQWNEEKWVTFARASPPLNINDFNPDYSIIVCKMVLILIF